MLCLAQISRLYMLVCPVGRGKGRGEVDGEDERRRVHCVGARFLRLRRPHLVATGTAARERAKVRDFLPLRLKPSPESEEGDGTGCWCFELTGCSERRSSWEHQGGVDATL
jgi:hypothetical protein